MFFRSMTYLILVLPTFAHADSGDSMWGGEHPMMYGMGGFGMFMMLGIFVLIIMAVVMLVRSSGNDRHENTPLSILNERYARGDIDHDEYEERKKRLK